jgi:ribulose-phosphate 3-epimerase
MKISTSILGIKENLIENIQKLDNTTTDYIHIDIMDGLFVANKTWPFDKVKELSMFISKPLDIHLMVSDVKKYIDEFACLNPYNITFHAEAVDDLMGVITYLKNKNMKVCVSIKPATPVNQILPYLSYIDLILVMSVEPGRGGQTFIEDSIGKINQLYKLREEHKYHYTIEVDGGINSDTASLCSRADVLVSGSFITGNNDYQAQINKLQNMLK